MGSKLDAWQKAAISAAVLLIPDGAEDFRIEIETWGSSDKRRLEMTFNMPDTGTPPISDAIPEKSTVQESDPIF